MHENRTTIAQIKDINKIQITRSKSKEEYITKKRRSFKKDKLAKLRGSSLTLSPNSPTTAFNNFDTWEKGLASIAEINSAVHESVHQQVNEPVHQLAIVNPQVLTTYQTVIPRHNLQQELNPITCSANSKMSSTSAPRNDLTLQKTVNQTVINNYYIENVVKQDSRQPNSQQKQKDSTKSMPNRAHKVKFNGLDQVQKDEIVNPKIDRKCIHQDTP